MEDDTGRDDDCGDAQRYCPAVPQSEVGVLVSAEDVVEVLVDAEGKWLWIDAEEDGQGRETRRRNPQQRGERMHVGHGVGSAAALALSVLLRGESAPQEAQRVGHGQHGAHDDAHQEHVAWHANEQLLVKDGFKRGFLGHKAQQGRDARHGQCRDDGKQV